MKRKIELEQVDSPFGPRFVVRGYISEGEPRGRHAVNGWFGAQLNGEQTKTAALKTAGDFFTASEPIVRKLIMP